MAYTTIDNPELYFQTKIYSGNSSTQAITLDGSKNMSPDFCWFKMRSHADNHVAIDSVRGSNKAVYPDITLAETTQTHYFSSFDSNGFTLGNSGIMNTSGRTYVSWNWKEDATAGFDIVSFTGNETARTISHSLSAVPHWMIVKPRESGSEGWSVYHHKIASDPETDVIRLDETNASFDNSGYWNDTAPTSSVFSVGNDSATNHNGGGIIAYLWSEKKGFSKFGSYIGNGNANGTFVYTGFKPAFILTRNLGSSHGWWILDNKRDTLNPTNGRLVAESNNAEDSAGNSHDFLSNGFKLRTSSSADVNGDGDTMIYMAFAESPFVNSNGVPCNAR